LRVRPTPERPLSPWVINTVSRSPEAIAAAAWRTWIINEQPRLTPEPSEWKNLDSIWFCAYVLARIDRSR
jgi:hypothetical protein